MNNYTHLCNMYKNMTNNDNNNYYFNKMYVNTNFKHKMPKSFNNLLIEFKKTESKLDNYMKKHDDNLFTSNVMKRIYDISFQLNPKLFNVDALYYDINMTPTDIKNIMDDMRTYIRRAKKEIEKLENGIMEIQDDDLDNEEDASSFNELLEHIFSMEENQVA